MSARIRLATTLAGCLESGGYVCSVAALKRGPISVAAVMIDQFAVVAALLGIVVLRERPRPMRVAGACCTMAAVVLFAIAG